MQQTTYQCSGIRKRLRCSSVLMKTYCEGSGPGRDRTTGSITLARGCSGQWASKLIPEAGKSGNDFPAGTGITSVFPPGIRTKKNFPSEDHPDKQSPTQIFLGAPPRVGTARTADERFSSAPGDNTITHSPSGETPNFSRIGAVVIRTRPLPSSLIRTSPFVFSSSERNTRSPSAPKDT